MSDKNPLDPTRDNGSNKAPLGDPSAPPNPSTQQAGSNTKSAGSGTAGGIAGSKPTSSGSGTATPGSGATGSGASGSSSLSGSSTSSASGSGSSTGSGSGSHQHQAREELNETGGKLKSQARDTVRELADSARASAEAQAERKQAAAAGELGGIAKALRKTADEVEGQSYLPLDRYARQAADKLDDLSENLRGSDIRTVIGRLETYTREQPGVVLGGAIITGFLLARFMRSSAEHDHEGESDFNYGRSRGGSATVSSPGAGLDPDRNTGQPASSGGAGIYPGSNSVV